MYIAHQDHKNKREPHYLHEHVQDMRVRIKGFELDFDLYGMTEASVILHDVGKKSEKFQSYIQNPKGKRGSVQHAKGGAYALRKAASKLNSREQRYISELIQIIVAGHHTGLTNFDKTLSDKMTALPKELSNIERLSMNEVEEVVRLIDVSHIPSVIQAVNERRFNVYISVLVRFVMSALVDADYLSTEAYFSKGKADMRLYDSPTFSEFDNMLVTYISNSPWEKEEGILNELKNEVQELAYQKGEINHSFFTLHAPTGTGKTIASLRFAINHARKYNKARIITALPLINLTEEISSIYQAMFGKEHVIEDHSSISFTNYEEGPLRLAAENWDRKFIITTTVQLFESLFHHKPMKLRKLHRLENSIIILDEYHKLPLHILEPILQQLDILQTQFNVTVLLTSATPYPFYKSKRIQEMNLIHNPIEITNYKSLYERVPSRVKYEWSEDALPLHEVSANLSKEEAVLAIVNTRKEAQQLHKLLVEESNDFEAVYYVSTTMCSAHRKRVLDEIKLFCNPNNPRPIAVVATQVLEAGIDISFPVVYRMIAPLDAIVQAAGRCNRYGEVDLGKVVLFKSDSDIKVDQSYEYGIKQTESLLKEKGVEGFTEPDSFIRYYRRIFDSKELNKPDINASNCLYFEDVSKRFQMIEDNRLSVICMDVPGFATKWLEEDKSPSWWRKIQPFVVSVSPNEKNYKVVNDVKVLASEYDDTYGIKL